MPWAVSTATISCSFGAAPSVLTALPVNRITATMPAASVSQFEPVVAIAPFGMCNSPSNPTVAAATAAALGVLTPMPCIPVVTAPWTPGAPTVMTSTGAALSAESKCMCSWGGVITIDEPGQTTVQIP